LQEQLKHPNLGGYMASNFQISSYKRKGVLYIQLNGDFDASSAHELLNALRGHCQKFYQIHVDTDNLKTIYPFGRVVFNNNLKNHSRQLNNIVFAGKNKIYLAPTWLKGESL